MVTGLLSGSVSGSTRVIRALFPSRFIPVTPRPWEEPAELHQQVSSEVTGRWEGEMRGRSMLPGAE